VPKALVEAPTDVLELIVDKAVLGCLVRIQNDLATPLVVSVSQGAKPDDVVRVVAAPNPPAGEPLVGKARVNVRLNYGGDRYIFRAEVIFPPSLSPETGFSGFSVPGSVTVSEDGLRLDSNTWALQYNDWDFKNWV